LELITTSKKLSDKFIKLTEKYTKIAFATAWASADHPAFNAMLKHRNKIQHSTIGLHFYQTDPKVLEEFKGHEDIGFIQQTDGVFHPKLYLFWNASNDWALLSGSANFTKGAFAGSNQEAMILIQGESDDVFKDLIHFLKDECFDKAEKISNDEIDRYRVLHQDRKTRINTLSNHYTDTQKKNSGMKQNILSTKILTYSWGDYFKTIQQDENHQFEERLALLDYSKQNFQDNSSFLTIDLEDRKLISGLPNIANTKTERLDYGWFGSTHSNGKFRSLINNGNQKVAEAIDEIPLTGKVSREDFLEYYRLFQKIDYTNPIGISTRLLAMKRRDLFFCFNGANKKGICEELGLSQNLNAERYWDEILLRIYDTPWFNSSRPSASTEQQAWSGRVALIDCIYYKPKNKK